MPFISTQQAKCTSKVGRYSYIKSANRYSASFPVDLWKLRYYVRYREIREKKETKKKTKKGKESKVNEIICKVLFLDALSPRRSPSKNVFCYFCCLIQTNRIGRFGWLLRLAAKVGRLDLLLWLFARICCFGCPLGLAQKIDHQG